MPVKSQAQTLTLNIHDLAFTEDFKELANTLQFKTVGEMLSCEVSDLLKLPGFTYHMLQQLVQFLEEKKLAHLLKQ